MKKGWFVMAVLGLFILTTPQVRAAESKSKGGFFSRSKKTQPQEKPVQKDPKGRFQDVGSEDNVTRLSEEETEELREKYRKLKVSLQAGKDGNVAAETTRTMKTVQAAKASQQAAPKSYKR